MHLEKLMKIVETEGKDEPYACIKDLVENGLSPGRFAAGEHRPNRNEATIFLAAWCRRMGFTPEVYRDWLIDYAVDVLSRISSSAPSQIRHSTKSIIKFIHGDNGAAFSCNCQHNAFKARCSSECPIYGEMEELYFRNLEIAQQRNEELQQQTVKNAPEPDPATLSVTKRFRKQYDEAVALITQYLKEGRTKKDILGILQAQGYKTITGRDWKPGNISRISEMNGLTVIKRPRRKKEAAPASECKDHSASAEQEQGF
jgi:hypothetical protein